MTRRREVNAEKLARLDEVQSELERLIEEMEREVQHLRRALVKAGVLDA